MTAPTAAPPATNGSTTGGGAKQQKQVMTRPFVAGTRRIDSIDYDETKTMNAGTQDMPVWEISPDGFVRGAFMLVEGTTASNVAATAFTADGVFAAIDTITMNDTNNKAIFGPMGGHDWYECLKFGGYAFSDDAKLSPIFNATTGTGATGGSFAFVLWLPIEIVQRDGLGALPNKSSSATYNVSVRLAPTSAVYSTAPTNAPSVRIRWQLVGWMDPNAADMRGNPVAQNPPAVQSTQYWDRQTYTVNSGAFNFRLLGIDSLVRNLIFVLLDADNSRQQGDSDFPDPFTLQYETAQPINRVKNIWRHMIGRDYGYNETVETAGGRDYGVYPEPYNKDFELKPGNETRLGYMPVSSSTTLKVSGNIGGTGSHTLVLLVNKIVPAGGDPMVLTGR